MDVDRQGDTRSFKKNMLQHRAQRECNSSGNVGSGANALTSNGGWDFVRGNRASFVVVR